MKKTPKFASLLAAAAVLNSLWFECSAADPALGARAGTRGGQQVERALEGGKYYDKFSKKESKSFKKESKSIKSSKSDKKEAKSSKKDTVGKKGTLGGVPPTAPPTSITLFDFSPILPAQTIEQSVAGFDERKNKVIQWFAATSLPGCGNADNDDSTNCRLDGKISSYKFSDWMVANIILNNDLTDGEEILLANDTIPWGVTGTGINFNDPDAVCHRKGDYDFALIDFLHVAYTSNDFPGRLSDAAYDRLVNVMLTFYGNDHDKRYILDCGLLQLSLQDTENHILREQIAQYLTNQLLLAESPGNATYDNELNGNNAWMLNYLADFFDEWWYEYNARPYQEYNVLGLSLLATYAEDPDVKLTAVMLMDLMSAWTAMQSNNDLVRFMPFRRQDNYILPDKIDQFQGYETWAGTGELERFAMVAGNFGYLQELNWTLPPGDGQQHFILYGATGSYRMNDILLDLTIGNNGGQPHFFSSSHGNDGAPEAYYHSPHFHISAGGVYKLGEPFSLSGFDGLLPETIEYIINIFDVSEGGWARPTTMTPLAETSNDIRDMMQFQGHKELGERGNTCIVPAGFACGLTAVLGNKVEATGDSCVTQIPGSDDWKFFDFQASSGCELGYDLMVAWYSTSCDDSRCTNSSDTNSYGLMEVVEVADTTLNINQFAAQVLQNNPNSFASSGIESYTTISGDVIEFEINPESRTISSLVSFNGVAYTRDTENWAIARGTLMKSATKGQWTIDSINLGKRMILDMTQPQTPRKLIVGLPSLDVIGQVGFSEGTYFDGSGSVAPNATVSHIGLVFSDLLQSLNGIRIKWDNGLETVHGDMEAGAEDFISLTDGEYLDKMDIGFGLSLLGTFPELPVITFLQVTTSDGRSIKGGSRLLSDTIQTFRAPNNKQIVAVHGHAFDATPLPNLLDLSIGSITGLGVVYAGV